MSAGSRERIEMINGGEFEEKESSLGLILLSHDGDYHCVCVCKD